MNDSNSSNAGQSLKDLKKQKGIKSRAIGEAKKSNQPFEHLLDEVKALTLQIKSFEANTNKETRSEDEPEYLDTEVLPPQFVVVERPAGEERTLSIKENIDMTAWDAYVEQHPNATIYHSGAIRKVVEDSFGHQCHYLSVIDDDNQVQGILPLVEMKSLLFGHFLVSMPFFNYGGLLASSDKAAEALVEAATDLAIKLNVDHIEYRHCHQCLDLPARTDKVAMLLQLPDNTEQLWNQIGTKVRAQIKKAERFEPATKIGKDELIDDFYRVFSRNMRDLGTPVYGKKFFENMIRSSPDGKIVIIYVDEHPVSAAFLVGWRNTLEIPWASTLREANKYDSNMKLYWEVLKLAIKYNYQVFDFGRSSLNGPTFKFKKQWGTRRQNLYWHYWLPGDQALPHLNSRNPKYALFSMAWKFLPISLSNRLGPQIVKKVP